MIIILFYYILRYYSINIDFWLVLIDFIVFYKGIYTD